MSRKSLYLVLGVILLALTLVFLYAASRLLGAERLFGGGHR